MDDRHGISRHVPVMSAEVLRLLDPAPDGCYVDGTLGGGGHARAIADRLGPEGCLIALDRDPRAVERARRRLEGVAPRVLLLQRSFADLDAALGEAGAGEVDGVLLDLGLSSDQLAEDERGFSYQAEGELDMRFGPDGGRTALDLVADLSDRELGRLIGRYGEERWAGRIARFIKQAWRGGRLRTTRDLVRCIEDAVPASARRRGPHPARRTFQALRIAVNDELAALEAVLPQALDRLAPGGRLCVISYHSLEDRIVKRFMTSMARECRCPPNMPQCRCSGAQVRLLTRRPLRPTESETAANPRARSARLRAAERLRRPDAVLASREGE